ncbi:sugar (and other) transporter family protein [Rickettsia hoogstraalii str. RCCE3]|nr:sugar (and other) transporter family protein [Rickettsia hoogstraalii str. RCCE3]
MAVLLNELFSPKSDPYTHSLLAAFSFCATFVFRPVGALIFGWIGDNIGRKTTIIITTFLMALSCLLIAVVPTYAEIGFTAALIFTLCRIVQGMSSMGEKVGAELYLTEITAPPIQYPIVSLIAGFSTFGTSCALGVASLILSLGINWRIIFVIGAVVALVGTVARKQLRETPEFVNAKLRLTKAMIEINKDPEILKTSVVWNEKVNKKTAFAIFLINCVWPICFYFVYVHCSDILKHSFNYNPEQIINHNFIVSLSELASFFVLLYLSYKIHPLKILKFVSIMFLVFVLICPYLLIFCVKTPFTLLCIQSFLVAFAPGVEPAAAIFFKHLPIFKRFTYSTFMYAAARALIYAITSFGMIYLIKLFNHWGLLIVMLPVSLGYIFGINHFRGLEIVAGNYPQKV